MKRISFDLSVSGCKAAIKELLKYEREIKPKLDEVCRRLAEIGKQEVDAVVSQINPDEGNAVDKVEVVKIDNGYKLVMSGKDVYFIEFGTGDQVNSHFDTSVPVAWGTWSAEHKQFLWNQGFWFYDKKRFTGTEAYMPMYYAEKRMREEKSRVYKEVFGE